MAAGINHYKSNIRELSFVLNEQFGLSELLGKPPFDAWGPDEVKAVLEQVDRFAKDVLGPMNSSADRECCRLEGGQVYAPKGFKEAWKGLYEAGFKSVVVPADHGGQGAPYMVYLAVEEMISGANVAFGLYPGLALGAVELLLECATKEQIEKYGHPLIEGKWGGTMCLTEPQAGSDVGASKAAARKNADGTYQISGTKLFISAGDHDLTDNIVHLVLARVEGAPLGTKGLSLFIVPKIRVNADGSLGKPNDVAVGGLEHKMGINGSSTALLNFGENDGCVGELMGGVENQGMSQMFKMMNNARIAVGLQSTAVLSTAYLNALAYARERKQGSNFRQWKDPKAPRVPIVDHPDVRRMLLELKAYSEGLRMLLVKLASHMDRARALAGTDDEKVAYHKGQVELLTPLVKSYNSDQSFRLCAQAIQVYGGPGYTKDYPVEQYTRDAKIFSIYEGTNHIQAMDLVGRKLGLSGGMFFQQFMADVGGFVEANRSHKLFAKEVEHLGAAQEAVMQGAMGMLGWSQSPENFHLIPLNANRFLNMMSEVAVGWLLLEAGVIADKAQEKLGAEHPDRAFYEGKKASAWWFGRNVLPTVPAQAQMLGAEDSSAMNIPDAGFGAE